MKMRFAALVLVLLPGTALMAFAQEPPARSERSVIRVNGEATVSARPDQAEIDIAVITGAQTAEAARSENAAKLEAVLAALKKTLGPDADIRTVGYWLTPAYTVPKPGGQARITGYTASNVVRARTSNLDRTGPAIDSAIQAGANNVQRLSFTLKDEQSVRAQALRDAAIRARASAEALASALGVRITGIAYVEESGGQGRGIFTPSVAMASERAVQTPVEPGTIDIQANVILAVEISR